MVEKRLQLLLCNDDGIEAPGIHKLWHSLKESADILIVAPATNQSCKGIGMSLPHYIEAEKHVWEDGVEAWKVQGTPADCIKFALHYLCKAPPDFILSGINDGSNAGKNILYSGTVGAVIQGIFLHVPGIAFSSMYKEGDEKYAKAAHYIPAIVQHFASHRPKEGTLLNVNFPEQPKEEIQGLRMSSQGQSYWDAKIGSNPALKGTKKYPVLDSWYHLEEEEDSDIALLQKGYITCTPIHVQDLTDHVHKEEHRDRFESLNADLFPSNPQ